MVLDASMCICWHGDLHHPWGPVARPRTHTMHVPLPQCAPPPSQPMYSHLFGLNSAIASFANAIITSPVQLNNSVPLQWYNPGMSLP
jgi:hypothetical protein